MLPLQQAFEVKTAVLDYIKATFHFKDSEVGKAFYRFIEDEKKGLFKGPYVSLKTPFIKADKDEDIPLEIKPTFKPHKHQVDAFQRLTMRDGHQPQPTLLTTGTGSGKTECFLYPILDYVYQMNKDVPRKGVKVIIMYPMNALASDQATRLAEAIWGTEDNHPMRGKVTAGLFIGESADPSLTTVMEEHKVIENREKIVNFAPDIILTNFKMLDYGLMQQRYMPLWQGNIGVKEPMLRFIVLDELHTYDGAQGTDVANLIRRLKLKLSLSEGMLTPIGTSATIGNSEDSKQMLCQYASDVFGVEFTEDSIIEEHRVSVDDFFDDNLIDTLPSEQQLETLDVNASLSADSYVRNVLATWLPDCSDDKIEIGNRLRKLQIVHDLLDVTSAGVLSLSDLNTNLGLINLGFKNILTTRPDLATSIVESLLALICEAKLPDDQGNPKFPLLYLQIQLWQRELSGIQRVVQAEPEFTWRDAIPKDERIALPIYFCRDCGESGWLTTKKDTERKFGTDAARINEAFMNYQNEVRLMNLESPQHTPIDEYNGDLTINETFHIHPDNLTIGREDEDNVLPIRIVSHRHYGVGNRLYLDHKCPLCMSDSLAIVGGRTSTLSSIAVSQVMSSDFDNADGSKRKLLTFSNSVQDAAHLAGFYEVRTFRFLFRQSIQYYLKQVGKPISLSELQDGFKKFWKERLDGDEYYYRFMPDDLIERINLKENYRDHSTGQLTDKFKEEFDLRVDWEICSEFGFMSQRGRTLEKMGSSATFFSKDSLHRVFEEIKPYVLDINLEYVADNEDLFLHFVNGILHRLRVRGGVDHEFLRLYRTQQLKPVMLNWPRMKEVHFLHRGFARNRVPHMMGYQSVHRGDEVLDVTTKGRNPNWFYLYFIHSIMNPAGITPLPNQDAINDFYAKLMEVLADHNILDRQVASGLTNYAIRPDAIYVEPATRTICCDKCGSRMYVAESDALTKDMACLDFKCDDGLYTLEEDATNNYYHKVYDKEPSPRIYAHEHTGLLERSKRETIERDFREQPTPQSCNVLTATSTLEMGIDIGDLNVVANTGIPPKPSNFLQRIGRAGRKEGAALVLNYAKSEKHDMYYFTEPLSMIEGVVSTPGCFLEARDILRRHFLAFCIDSWTSADGRNVIPNKIQYLPQNFTLLTDENFFVNRIRKFVKEHQILLTEKFRREYPLATQPILDEIFTSLDGDEQFFENILKEFEQLLTRINQIKQERKELQERLREIPETDTERREDILNQNRALRAQEKTIANQSVIEFMTNAGLLPNYAFPETGVKFAATIFYNRAIGDDIENIPDPESIELVRPASQGVRELAPDNTFYTQKLKLKIKGLSLKDRADSVKEMRFCSKCDALAEETTPEFDSPCCPKCGHASWRTNKHKFLRFTTANTSVYKNEAVLDDRKEDRNQEFYHTLKHFQFNHLGNVTSYGLKNVAFGIEFCKDVELTEVNYGNQKQLADPVEVNNTEHISRLGFVTCTHCGKTTSILYGAQEATEMHFPYCNKKDIAYPADEDNKDVFEHLYLYRTMRTEAIKVLLPVQLFDTESSTQLFKAGLELGMKHYYKSSPEHIIIDAYREYNKATQDFDNYLVLYDTIPGGTGYLSKLYDKEEFSKLLRISYEHIRDCECRLEGKDGCYQCILSYGNQWQRNNLSRERAEELFKNIVDECDNWEDIEGGIGSITASGIIEDSELELLFVKAMEAIARDNHWIWEKKIDAISETYSYVLIIKKDGLELKYNVYPQYRLGPAQGVAKVTKPDFQFICSYAKVNGVEIDLTQIAQWSVYLDGYAYHASAENNGFDNDFARREAIRQCDNILRQTWTFTWADIKPYVQPEAEPHYIDGLYVASPNPSMLEDFENDLRKKKDSVGRFLFMLTHPDIDVQRQEAFFYIASCWTDENGYMSSYEHIDDALRENARGQYAHSVSEEDMEERHFFIKTNFIPHNSLLSGSAWYPYDQYNNYGDSFRYQWSIKEGQEAINKEDWEDFWRRYNILQFFRNESSHQETIPINLDEIIGLFPGLEEIVTELVNNHIPFNTEGGYELMEDEIIIAEAAIKIDDKDIVIDDFDDATAKLFHDRGYTIYTPSTFNINEIKNT